MFSDCARARNWQHCDAGRSPAPASCCLRGIKNLHNGENVMIICSLPRSFLLGGVFIGAFTFTAAAQQPAKPAGGQSASCCHACRARAAAAGFTP